MILKFLPQISVGNVITLVGMVAIASAAWADINNRIDDNEKAIIRQKETSQLMRIEIRDEFKTVNIKLDKLVDRELDRLERLRRAQDGRS